MPPFAMPMLLSQKPKNNKAKVSRQLLSRTKSNPSVPPTTSSVPVEKAATPTVAARCSQKPTTANASQSVSNDAIIRSSKNAKTMKRAKTSHSSPLSKQLPSFLNAEAQINTKLPRMHRDMKLICDEFRISEQSRLALRQYDAARLEDFCYMTDEDYAAMMDAQERAGRPIPPLQRRKIRVLLAWARSLSSSNTTSFGTAVVEGDAKTGGYNKAGLATITSTGTVPTILSSPGGLEGEAAVPSPNPPPYPPIRHAASAASSGIIVPLDWEKRFYADLPSLKEELKKIGGEPQLPTSWLSSLRIFCGWA